MPGLYVLPCDFFSWNVVFMKVQKILRDQRKILAVYNSVKEKVKNAYLKAVLNGPFSQNISKIIKQTKGQKRYCM